MDKWKYTDHEYECPHCGHRLSLDAMRYREQHYTNGDFSVCEKCQCIFPTYYVSVKGLQ